jgi:type II secretory pathway pseudopilin PulG
MRPHAFSRSRFVRSRKARANGFTLVELMVSLSGGLILSIAVFGFSRDVSRYYQRETRAAGATLASASGFERLSGELALAGHLSTGNIASDPRVCNRPDATWPAALRTLRAITTGTNAPAIAATELAPGRGNTEPQTVTIAGAISVPEVFTTRTVAPNGNGTWQVFLDLGTAASRRVGLNASAMAGVDAQNLQVMSSLFMAGGTGRILRLRRGGQDQYVIVSGVGTAPGQAFINLAAAPALRRTASGGSQCGISDLGELMAVSVINIVRYDIRPLIADVNYKALFDASGVGKGVPFEDDRAELVRVELDPSGTEIASTRELVAEYAVDLKITAWRSAGAGVQLLPVANPLNDQSNLNHLVRGVHVLLSLRSREADRLADVWGGSTNTARYRIGLGDNGTAPFARVRTMQSDIALRNLENNNW